MHGKVTKKLNDGRVIQIWDDNKPREANRHRVALFDLIPAEGAAMRPYDAFNEARTMNVVSAPLSLPYSPVQSSVLGWKAAQANQKAT